MEIIIKVSSEDLMLRGGDMAFELCRQRNRKDKKSGEMLRVWEAEKWYSNLEGAFHALLNMKLKAADANSLHELKKEIENIRAELVATYNTECRILKAT